MRHVSAGADAPLRGLSLADGPLVVVTGAEGAGLSRLVRATCDQIVIVTVSGRGDKDVAAIARYRGERIHD